MQEERYGSRDRTYSAWHRRLSTQRFVGIERAQTLHMIDLDASLWVEFDNDTKEPLALIETAKDVGQTFKNATVTRNLAKRCNPPLPAYVLLYKVSETRRNPDQPQCMDIDSFRAKRLWPQPQVEWQEYTPDEWAKNLVKLREWSAAKIDDELNRAS